MGRSRKYTNDAERQAAYRERKKGDPDPKPVKVVKKVRVVSVGPVHEPPVVRPVGSGCGFVTPRGTKCKLCGKVHL